MGNKKRIEGHLMRPRTKYKRTYEIRDEELVNTECNVAPKKGERKKLARVGVIQHEMPPKKGSGLSRSERRVKEAMEAGKKLKQESKKNSQKKRKIEERDEPAAIKRLKEVERLGQSLEGPAYERALRRALVEGLQEQRKEEVVVARSDTRKQQKNRERRARKRAAKQERKDSVKEEKQRERDFRGQVEAVGFHDRVQAPLGDLAQFTAKLDVLKQKAAAKRIALDEMG